MSEGEPMSVRTVSTLFRSASSAALRSLTSCQITRAPAIASPLRIGVAVARKGSSGRPRP